MRYNVYTDGACTKQKGISGCAYIILTNDTYVSSHKQVLTGVTNPTQAETIGIGLAAKHMLRDIPLTKEDIVEFNTDCFSSIKFCREFVFQKPKSTVRSKVAEVRIAMEDVRQLSKVCTVRFSKVKGHKDSMNPNTFVDRLCKIAIRKG